jgi:hypothetical protein
MKTNVRPLKPNNCITCTSCAHGFRALTVLESYTFEVEDTCWGATGSAVGGLRCAQASTLGWRPTANGSTEYRKLLRDDSSLSPSLQLLRDSISEGELGSLGAVITVPGPHLVPGIPHTVGPWWKLLSECSGTCSGRSRGRDEGMSPPSSHQGGGQICFLCTPVAHPSSHAGRPVLTVNARALAKVLVMPMCLRWCWGVGVI